MPAFFASSTSPPVGQDCDLASGIQQLRLATGDKQGDSEKRSRARQGELGDEFQEVAAGESGGDADKMVEADRRDSKRADRRGEKGAGEWDVDEWFGTRYRVRRMPDDLVKKGKDWFSHLVGNCGCGEYGQQHVDAMALPPPNKYIAVESEILAAPHDASLTPKQVLDTPTIKAWHLLDVSLGAPRASIFLSLHSPIVDTSARCAALLRLLLEVLELRINEQRYMAEEAGMSIDITNFSFTSPCYGLRLLLHGFSGKLHLLLQDVTTTLAELSITQDVFDMAKEKAETDYKNRKFQQPFLHAMLSNHRFLEKPFFSDEQRLAELQKLTPTDLALFHADFLSQMQVDALVVGNMDATAAKMRLLDLQNTINMGKLKDELQEQTIARLPGPASHTLHVQLNKDADHLDSAVSVYLQIGVQTHKLDASLQLLCQMVDKEAYAQLRTREQLGYIVAAEVAARWGVTGLRIAVQSARAPDDVHQRVEAFLVCFRQYLVDLDEETFNDYVTSLITKKLEKDRTLHQRASRLFHEIVSRTHCWNRREQQVDELRKVTKAALLEIYDTYIMPGAPLRRKLSSYIVGKVAIDAGAYPALKVAGHDGLLVTRTGTCAAMTLEEAQAERVEGWNGEEGSVGGACKSVALNDFVAGLTRFPALR